VGRDAPAARDPGVTTPDPARVAAGWEHRFTAAEPRATEMVELYRELGFDVVADPVDALGLPLGCSDCFGSGASTHRSIYTRRSVAGAGGGDAPMQAHPTRVLRDEHQWILGVAGALESLVDAPAPDLDILAKCIRFIRLFADACHHGKEEDLLFPALVDEGLSERSGPIAVMLYEHRLGRGLVAEMVDALEGARAGDASSQILLVRAARDYVDLIRSHILKEDHVLFEMADQLVAGEACTRLCVAYDGTCDHTFEGCTKAQLEELGREIVGAMPGA